MKRIHQFQEALSLTKRPRVNEDTSLINEIHEYEQRLLQEFLSATSFVVVAGPSGSGKKSIVKQVAARLKYFLKSVTISSTANDLWGSYEGTKIPGEIIFSKSTFNELVKQKVIVLFENVNVNSPNFLMLLEVCRTMTAQLFPGCDSEPLHAHLKIVCTVRTEAKQTKFSSQLYQNCPWKINMKTFTSADMVRILTHKFQVVPEHAEKFIVMYIEIARLDIKSKIDIHSLLRICRRISLTQNFPTTLAIFKEAIEIFAFNIRDMAHRRVVSKIVARCLGVSNDIANSVLRDNNARVSTSVGFATFGRVSLPIRDHKYSAPLSIGLTSNVRSTLEQIGVCLAQDGSETVLLTGESGVGKSTIIQSLASFLRVELDVVNLIEDSTSHLSGGFLPIAVVEQIQNMFTQFRNLLSKTCNIDQNDVFLSQFRVLFSEERYLEFIRLIAQTSKKILMCDDVDTFKWTELLVECLERLNSFEKATVTCSYVEGVVTKAAKAGRWLLVENFQLISDDQLEIIKSLLDRQFSTHPDFRLLMCKTSDTEAQNQKLPPDLNSNLTEFVVHPTTNRAQLKIVIRHHMPNILDVHLSALVNFYREAIETFPKTYSLHNLCRALLFSAEDVYTNVLRSLYEGVVIAFANELDFKAYEKMSDILSKHFPNVPVANAKPNPDKKQVIVEDSYIEQGNAEPQADSKYVFTKSVRNTRSKLARVVARGKLPVLLVGEMDVGKTSAIMNLALTTGNVVHRIYNHKHTELREYIGHYVLDADRRLTFVEGPLLQAVRKGDWVILEDLNLAPVAVLKALNGLLDVNRELYVAEKNITVPAHSRFRLFATLKSGTYAGRTKLHRSYRNRFAVIHVDRPPADELVKIVSTRYNIDESPAKSMVEVLTQLRMHRSSTGIFNSSDGFMSLKDLFRWANRSASNPSDQWKRMLAEQGFFLLAAKCRTHQDTKQVIRVLKSVFKVKIDEEYLFGEESPYLPEIASEAFMQSRGVVSTFGMRRMIILASQAFRCNEPVLMVGETGCGKTTAATVLSAGDLLAINCHGKTEIADLLGSFRPQANSGFFWQDGCVVQAMKAGSLVLIDDISFVADAELNELLPLLESSRTVRLVNDKIAKAADGFQLIATMNPGNDIGHNELDPALRNRFTEIWCSIDFPVADVQKIVAHELGVYHRHRPGIVAAIAEFFTLSAMLTVTCFQKVFSITDVIAASRVFVACQAQTSMPIANAFVHAVTAVVMDNIGTIPSRIEVDDFSLNQFFDKLITDLRIKHDLGEVWISTNPPLDIDGYVNIDAFSIRKGPYEDDEIINNFLIDEDCVKENAVRVARALMINKPILLDGEPGVGKSCLIAGLASLTGHRVVRLNLSDQTDIADLIGRDVPVSDKDGLITFEWRDGPLLKAIKEGLWVILEEINLAPPSVLKGLSSCFDYRQRLFIPELNKTFKIDATKCRFFACQNPHRQGERLAKGLFNRFTTIRLRPLSMLSIISILRSGLQSSEEYFGSCIFNLNYEVSRIADIVCPGHTFDFNIRDLFRLRDFSRLFDNEVFGAVIIYVGRFATLYARQRVLTAIKKTFRRFNPPRTEIQYDDENGVYFGEPKYNIQPTTAFDIKLTNLLLLPSQEALLQQLTACVKLNWLVLLSGARNSGKTSVVRILASLAQVPLMRMHLNKDTDVADLIGCYEQFISTAELDVIRHDLIRLFNDGLKCSPASYKSVLLESTKSTGALNVRDIRRIIAKASEVPELDESDRIILKALTLKLEKIFLSFKWRSSVFVNAYTNGNWLLMEDVNCCSAAVLEQLNTCLEENGSLVLSETADLGSGLIKRHPNFRLFLTMDPENGPVSRTLRNRTVEIAMGSWNTWYQDPCSVLNIVLAKEKTMCSALSTQILNPTADEVVQILQAAARQTWTATQRLAAIPAGMLKNAPSTLSPTFDDRISFGHSNGFQLIMLPEHEVRCPPAELVLFDSNNPRSRTPTLSIAAWRWQLFDRWSKLKHDEDRLLRVSSIFVMALLSTTVEIATDDVIMRVTFTEIKQSIKSSFLVDVKSFLLNRERQNGSSSLIDRRFFAKSSVTATECDRYVLAILLKWFSAIYSHLTESADIDSIYAQSNDARINGVMNSIVAASSRLAVSPDQEISFDKKFLGWLYDFLVFTRSVTRTAGTTKLPHPLYVRRCFQALKLSSKLSDDKFNFTQEERFNLQRYCADIGETTTTDGTQYKDKLGKVCRVDPLETQKEADDIGIICQKIKECVERVEKTEFVHPKTVYSLTEGMRECVTAMRTMETLDCTTLTLQYPDSPIHSAEFFRHFEFCQQNRKEIIQCLVLLNSNFGVSRIDSSISQLSDIRTYNVMLSVICNFWTLVNWSSTSTSAISLRDLLSTSCHLDTHIAYTWLLNCKNTGSLVEFDTKIAVVAGNCTEFDYVQWCVLNVLQGLIPQKGMVDPGFAVHVEDIRLRTKLSLVKLFTDCPLVFPVASSAHPLLRYLSEIEAELKPLGHGYVNRVHRPSSTKFEELQNVVLTFYQRWEKYYDVTAKHANVQEESPEQLEILIFIYEEMIEMLRTFGHTLMFEYFSLPDIVVPLLLVVYVLRVIVSYNRQCAKEAYNRHCVEKKLDIHERVDPVSFDVKIFSTSTALRKTCLSGPEGQMPMHLQLQLAESFIFNKNPVLKQAAVDWLFREWDRWFTNHSVRNTIEERNHPSEQDDDAYASFANFANWDFVISKSVPQSSLLLNPRDILRFSRRLFAVHDKSLADKQVEAMSMAFLPTAWVFERLKHSSLIKKDPDAAWCSESLPTLPNTVVDGHLVALKAFERFLAGRNNSKKTPINVYNESDVSGVIRGVKAIQNLYNVLKNVCDVFPEDANLREAEKFVEMFLDCDSGVPQLKMASWIENVFERCERWNVVSPPQYSMAAELNELQKILVDWRKMQISTWLHINHFVEDDSRALTFATGYPIILKFVDMTRSQEWNDVTNLYSMILSWVMSSTLMDFEARIELVRFLGCLADYMSDFMVIGSDVPVSLRSMGFFLEAFKPLVVKKYEQNRRKLVQVIKNFFASQDFQLWSVKAFTLLTHDALFDVVKEFKANNNIALRSVLIEFLPPVPILPAFEVTLKPTLAVAEGDSFNFVLFHEHVCQVLNALPGHNVPETLSGSADELLRILSTDVAYVENDDAINEGLQNETVAERQRRFADLIQQAAAFGLSSQNSTDELADHTLQDALSSIATGSGISAELFRSCAVAKNVVTRLVNQFNENALPFITKQLTPEMLGHIRGLTTFNHVWLINMVSELKEIAAKTKAFIAARDEIQIFAGKNEKHASMKKTQRVSDLHVQKTFQKLQTTIAHAVAQAKLLIALVDAVPSAPSQGEFVLPNEFVSEMPLTMKHKDYKAVLADANTVLECFEILMVAADKVSKSKIRELWCRKAIFEFFDTKQCQSLRLQSIISPNSALFRHFPRHCRMISNIEENLPSLSDVVQDDIPERLTNADTFDIEIFQLRLQQIYASIVTKAGDKNTTPVDVIKQIALVISKETRITSELDLLVNITTSSTEICNADIPTYKQRLTEVIDTLKLVDNALGQFVNRICVLFVQVFHIFARILRKGFVNPIPTNEQGNEAGGEDYDMGEGNGANDVGDEDDLDGGMHQVDEPDEVELDPRLWENPLSEETESDSINENADDTLECDITASEVDDTQDSADEEDQMIVVEEHANANPVEEVETLQEFLSSRNFRNTSNENVRSDLGSEIHSIKKGTVRILEESENEDEFEICDRDVVHVSTNFFDLAEQVRNRLYDSEESDSEKDDEEENDFQSEKKFSKIEHSVQPIVYELADNIKKMLEKTLKNQLQGEYLTGKRIDMRLLRSCIASNFEKKKIWLRPTKKQQRFFQIMIAVDNSRSMSNSRMTDVTCQTLVIVEKIFRQLEIGQLAICKFDKNVSMLRDFCSAENIQEPLTASLLEALKFDQDSTNVIELLLAFARRYLANARSTTSTPSMPSQMLIIIGNGQDMHIQSSVISERVRLLAQDNVTVLYIIVDGENSVHDTKIQETIDGKVVLFPYMTSFPFPYYSVVGSINTLPAFMAEAVRQWFDLSLVRE